MEFPSTGGMTVVTRLFTMPNRVLNRIGYERETNGSLRITSISILASFNGEASITSISSLSRGRSLMRLVKKFVR
ncbi:hypothetical protein HAPAU_40950 [Halalkalicoccus paucihalophilus]|uniref:Uncharacterized protein n=1 Tax=Halalkalicoccus paucihalophilus TaxID=1008153 RepID=A0A151A8J6_9EURY|nr:hypothetical protein HAPAU_40950 [Halalkalicoccus paucihalophilus]